MKHLPVKYPPATLRKAITLVAAEDRIGQRYGASISVQGIVGRWCDGPGTAPNGFGLDICSQWLFDQIENGQRPRIRDLTTHLHTELPSLDLTLDELIVEFEDLGEDWEPINAWLERTRHSEAALMLNELMAIYIWGMKRLIDDWSSRGAWKLLEASRQIDPIYRAYLAA